MWFLLNVLLGVIGHLLHFAEVLLGVMVPCCILR